jgi:hypothetical protein
MHTERVALLFGAFGVIASLAGCPGTLEDKALFFDGGGAIDAGFAGRPGVCLDVPAQVFAPSCGPSGCHGPKSPQQGLDLVSPGVASRVVGIPSKECSGVLADPQNPDTSVIYLKLLPSVTCGAQMPLARPSLEQAKIDCIKSWIQSQGTGGVGGTPSNDAGATDSSVAD